MWLALTELLSHPIERADGRLLRVEASAQDAGGHRTEAVKAFARRRLLRRHIAIFGAKPNNAPVLSKGSFVDINWRGQLDKRGIKIHHVGTVGIKHMLYGRLSADADKPAEQRQVRFSEELPPEYFGGLVSETYNPAKNRFDKRRGAPRNEPLDTWVYAYAATHHPELRLHRLTRAEWDQREQRLATLAAEVPREPMRAPAAGDGSRGTSSSGERVDSGGTGFGSSRWSQRL